MLINRIAATGLCLLTSIGLSACTKVTSNVLQNISIGPTTAPVSSPVSGPAIDNEPAGSDVTATKSVIFTSDDLPGFSIAKPEGWAVAVKPFGTTEPQGFFPKGAEICGEACMGMRFTKGDVALELVALESRDDAPGERCSDTVKFEKIPSSLWTRIEENSGIYYSQSVKLDQLIDAGPPEALVDAWAGDGEWAYMVGTQYELCDARQNAYWLVDYKVTDQGSIMIEKPRIKGNPSPEVLAEIDELVASIKGI